MTTENPTRNDFIQAAQRCAAAYHHVIVDMPKVPNYWRRRNPPEGLSRLRRRAAHPLRPAILPALHDLHLPGRLHRRHRPHRRRPHLAGASSTSVQSGHGFSNLLADYPPNLFSEDCNAEEQPNLRDRFENDAHASYQPYFLGSELERHHYHHSTLQAPARPWESSGGLPAHGQTRIHNIPDFSSNHSFRDTSNDSILSFPPQLPTSGSSQVPAAYNLSAGPTYNVINERGSIDKNSLHLPSSHNSSTTVFEDVQPQPDSSRQPLLEKEISHSIRTRANFQSLAVEPHKTDHKKKIGKTRLFAERKRSKCRGPFEDPVQKFETSKTRKLGACLRCRMQRVRVSSCSLRS